MKKMILLLIMSFAFGLTYPVEATAAPPYVDQDELHFVDKVVIASLFINDDVIVIDCNNDQSAVMSHYSYDFTQESTPIVPVEYTPLLYVAPNLEGEDPSWNNYDNGQSNSQEANPYILYQRNVVNGNSYWQLE